MTDRKTERQAIYLYLDDIFRTDEIHGYAIHRYWPCIHRVSVTVRVMVQVRVK